MTETNHVSLSEYYSDSEREGEPKCPDLAEENVEAQASGSHGKDREQPRHHKQPAAPAPDAPERGVSSKGEGNRELTRSPSSHRSPVSDNSQRERTPCNQNIDVKKRRRRRRRRSTRAPGASEDDTATVPRIHKTKEVPFGSGDSERDLFSDDWQAHEQQKYTSLPRASKTRNMHYINGLPAIVRVFASGWFPSDMYAPLLKASECYTPMGDIRTSKAIERFSEALLHTSNRGAELNINLLHMMSQLRQTRREYAHEYTELSEQQTSLVICQFSTDFLLSPHQTAQPATTQSSLVRHLINKQMGCEYRVRAIIQVGLSRFDSWDAHDIKDLARRLLHYITAIEDLAANLVKQDQRYEHTRQSQSSGCQKRSKITRRARPWHRPTKPKKVDIRAHQWKQYRNTSSCKGGRKGAHEPEDDVADINSMSQPAKGASGAHHWKRHGIGRAGKSGRKDRKKPDDQNGNISAKYHVPAMGPSRRKM